LNVKQILSDIFGQVTEIKFMASNFMKLKRRRFYNLVCYVHNWNDGMLGYWARSEALALYWVCIASHREISWFLEKQWKSFPKTLIQTLKSCLFYHYSIIPPFHYSM